VSASNRRASASAARPVCARMVPGGSDLRQAAARHPERSSDRQAVGRDCVVPSRRRRQIAAGNSVAADRRDVLPTRGFRTLAARLVIGLEADRGQL
jgi:hypothetical protein